MSKLTDKQEMFCREYVIDWNATRAAIAAGYSEKTAYSIGNENLTKEYMSLRIKEISPEYIAKRKKIDSNKVKNDTGFVYIIHCKGSHYYKIGKTIGTLVRRIGTMQVGIPFDLVLIDSVKCDNHSNVEKYMHDAYRSHKVRGEWFLFTDDMVNQVQEKLNSF